ncbi:mediator of RNA polymerase II transcription subunit 13-like [Oppia nitens]|uniref:mediator of RNA polymerase II transcription subunit 13-like n=1 Tax=Oppia nitens TaxID=1686743 RepID=UPI0023DAC892|nr:mediator of RNA polymerase II transcription subunit 13-like [Oppia nitens]
MSHPNFVTNGSSLEDCHTNFFALADLCGIKWRRLICENSSVEPLEDPVLSSYCKCLASDQLCVWRRVKTSSSETNGNNNQFSKELWVFWYGEEPDFTDLVNNELTECETGSWETGLSYECRTLLFKAFHNIIERCLLSRGFARLGRWFFQPTEPTCATHNHNAEQTSKKLSSSGLQLTFAFNFFVHGDSTVCANIDVRQHPIVYRLTKADLQSAHNSQNGIKVILGPFGLAGVLTGQTFKDSDSSVQKVLNEWKQIYPLTQISGTKDMSAGSSQASGMSQHFGSDMSCSDFGNSSPNSVNCVVEVIVSGFRMKYPYCYVFTTDIDSQSDQKTGSLQNKLKCVTNISEIVSKDTFSTQTKPNLYPYQQSIPTHTYLLKHCVTQELYLLQQNASNSAKIKDLNEEASSVNNSNNNNTSATLWSVNDPCIKYNCNCFRCKSKKTLNSSKANTSNSYPNQSSSMSTNKKGDKVDKESRNKVVKNVLPFHRRSPVLNTLEVVNGLTSSSPNTLPTNTSNLSVSSVSQPTSVPTYSYKSPISGGGLPSLQSSVTTPTGANGIDSPRSVAQSLILDGTVSSVEQSNPCFSVSPHPAKDDQNSESQLNASIVASSPMTNKDRTRLEQLLSPNNSVKASVNINISEDSPSIQMPQWTPGGQSSDIEPNGVQTNASETNTLSTSDSNQTQPSGMTGVKRPLLRINSCEDNDSDYIRNSFLYDYSHLNDLNNFCSDIPPLKNRRTNYNKDFKRYLITDYYIGRKRMSPGSQTNGDIDSQFMLKSRDPYEFSDFDEEGAAYKAAQNSIKEEVMETHVVISSSPEPNLNVNSQNNRDLKPNSTDFSANSPQTLKGFTREDELVASYRDLDQIFDTSSGEDSNDELFQAPLTPSGLSNRNSTTNNNSNNTNSIISGTAVMDEHSKSNKTNSASSITLGVAELTRMFPTPPSLEPMAPSPCNGFLGPDATLLDDNMKYDLYPCSPNMIDTKDWSYVYKPPVQCQMVASSKYAPLPNIPNLPTIPKECKYERKVPPLPSPAANTNVQPVVQGISKPQINLIQSKTSSAHYNHLTPLKQNTMNLMSHSISRMGAPPPHSYNQMRLRPNMSPVPINQYQQMSNTGSIQHMQHIQQSHNPMYNMTQNDMSHSPLPHYHPNYNPDSNVPVPQGFYSNTSHPFAANHRSPHPSTSPIPAMHFNHQSQQQNAFISPNHLPQDPSLPETHSLAVNLLLSDSLLNLFRDHNFESCSLCVCNMNIKGNDVGVYLPDSLAPGGYDEPQYRCSCGFSAVVNRHRSYFAGLFYEDEVEITGYLYDPIDGLKKKCLAAIESVVAEENNVNENKENIEFDETLIDLIITQSTNVFSSCSVLSKAVHFDVIKDRLNSRVFSYESIALNNKLLETKYMRNPLVLIYKDGSHIASTALTSAKISSDNIPNNYLMLQNYLNDQLVNKSPLHEWVHRTTNYPVNNQEAIHLLRNLQPLLQESVQRKKTKMWEVTYTVSGPLTWRQFHRLAGRGTEDQCEPQPIPSLLVGYDRDCVALSPFALKFWEKLSLEPYSLTKDIAYVVVSPENDYILSHVMTFFKELSTTYEMLRLGKHCPISKVLRDGILRVGTRTARMIGEEPIDEWFNQIGEGNIASKLRMYAQACRYHLAPWLGQQTLDKSLFESNTTKPSNDSTNVINGNLNPSVGGINNANKPSNSPMPNSESNSEKIIDENHNDTSNQYSTQPNQQQTDTETDEDLHKQPAIVVYIIEPFTFGSNDKDLYRLSSVGLLRCYTQILRHIPDSLKSHIHLQLISLDSLLSYGKDPNGASQQDQLKELAFSVFSQCRQQIVHQSNVKSLTGFGPAAMFELFLKSKDPSSNVNRIYAPPFILAPLKDKQTELGEMFGDRREKSQILYCCYCLTEDQRWLIASCTNDKGDILETTSIYIGIPNRTRRRKASVRRFALDKLMQFVQTVLSESVTPWRLVIGRLGRIGHGELKDWSVLLSKKSLLRYSRQLRDTCNQCQYLTPFDQPAIFSACLVSLEADTALRVFNNHYTPDERFSSSCNTCSLSTPEDASCTHILVFPTSATTQSAHGSFSIDPLGSLGANIGEDDLLQAFNEDINDDDINVNDIFQWTESPPASPSMGQVDGLSHPDSPSNRQMGLNGSGVMKTSNNFGVDIQDEPTQLLQQPLALAFYVSTAKTGPLPRWFWSSCPHMEASCPVFLKSALLIHTPSVQQNSDDLLHTNVRNYHSLDSNLTTDVLRSVLEGYNALSWLSVDPSTHDRTSCLPIHIQLLMQLYHSVQALV